MKDTLSTLDLTEKPGQRITVFQHARHFQEDQRVDVAPGERIFSSGPQHSFYSYTRETPMLENLDYAAIDRQRLWPASAPLTILPQPGGGAVAPIAAADETRARLATDDKTRKATPLFSGLLRYFPDALAEVAALSKAGNDKHNPGEPLHWARSKSGDELDCVLRHMAEAGTIDTDGFYHDVKVAWRALANLQKLLEKERNLPISPGSRP